MSYIYNADIYCDRCGENIQDELICEGIQDDGTSDSFPQFVSDNNESDCPSHCSQGSDCLDYFEIDGTRYGKFLENGLTSDGVEYVKNVHRENPTDITEMWMRFYNLEIEESDDESEGDSYEEVS